MASETMRRFLPVVTLALLIPAAGSTQVWEKLVAPGLTYRMEVDVTLPRTIHVVRWNPAGGIVAKPELGGGTIYEADPTIGRETLSQMVKRTGAIGGINADFFPFTGDPLGLMVRDGELLSLPYPGRSVFAWGPGGAFAGIATGRLEATLPGFAPIPINTFNAEVPADSVGLHSASAGIARAKTPNRHAVLKIVGGDWKVGSTVQFEVETVAAESPAQSIPGDRAILTGTGNKLGNIAGLRPGQRISVPLVQQGFDWTKVNQAVAGGPNLVTGGTLALDAAAQSFNADFADKRHPRTAIGKTATGEIWLVAIDGRQGFSVGASLEELAKVMQRLGCMDAINLDGGGSTTLNLFGNTINRPSEGKEREIANAILFYGKTAAAPAPGDLKMLIPATFKIGTTVRLQVQDGKGRVVPSSRVLWTASGSGWIDQGGFLRPTAEGTIFVTAWVNGQSVSQGLQIPAN
jgi:hypothetical protein